MTSFTAAACRSASLEWDELGSRPEPGVPGQLEANGGARPLVFGSVCSGIEAASVAWKPIGWKCAFMSEIEAFPRSVLAHHYPETPLHGDFTTIKAGEYEPIDLLVGGTPCQSFSVAGLRGGLDDDRGNLALEYLRLADRLRPRWLVWENVPGVLSSNGGRDFGSILGGMGELGYGVAYRVLDAQFFGVAQRRRRVFVVGYLGDWRRAAAVLFERHSLSGNPAPRREAREDTARSLRAQSQSSHREDSDNFVAVASTGDTSHCLNAGGMGRQDYETETLIADTLRGHPGPGSNSLGAIAHVDCLPTMQNGADTPAGHSARSGHTKDAFIVPVAYGITRDALDRSGEGAGETPGERSGLGIVEEQAQCLKAKGPGAVAFALRGRAGGAMPELGGDVSHAIRTPGGGASVPMVAASAVRRLIPEECETLQGFKRGYTAVPHRGKPAADGPRYKALGNSMAVPVMAHIGRRIALVDAIATEQQREAA